MTNSAYTLYRPKEIALVNAQPFACPALVIRLPMRLDYWDGARCQSGRRADTLPRPWTAVTATLPGRGTVTQTLWISNSGGADLHFDLNWHPGITTAAPWLTVEPLTGTAAGATGVPGQLTFAAEPLAQAGVYTGVVVVTSNDEATGAMAVPVTLTVTGPQLTLGDATVYADLTCQCRWLPTMGAALRSPPTRAAFSSMLPTRPLARIGYICRL